ncbi:cell adhesion molecule Dscam1-like [Ornithodoros turicata]|uniref:cell adhesion molecule Dscam1-like n=1 Tax=Ornithodoros turicata TaxID=34597 RepID=UPI0031386871
MLVSMSSLRSGLFFLTTFIVSASTVVGGRQERRGPVFSIEPPSRVEFLNSTESILRCEADARPDAVITWSRVGASGPLPDIAGLRHVRPDGALVFSSFRAEDFRQDIHAAVYRCSASNSIGTIVSRDVHVRASVMQHFEAQVYDEFVIKGNTGVLRCQIPSFVKEYVTVTSWIRDDGLVIHADADTGGRYTVFKSGELHVRQVDSAVDNHRKYYCQAKHRITGEVRRSASVARLIIIDTHVNTSPRLTDRRPVVRARQGDTVKVPCAAQGYPVPSYAWYRIEGGWQVALDRGRFLQADGTLILRHAAIADTGKYVCVVNNSVGEDRMETQLHVTAPLSATVRPKRTVAIEGSSATLNCSVSGHPVQAVMWLRNGHAVSSRVKMLTRETLHIPSVLRDDKGMYQCFAINDYDSAQGTAEITLGDDPPVLTYKFHEQTMEPGSAVSLKCAATGTPLPQIVWSLDGGPVNENMRLRIGDFVTNDGFVNSFVNVTAARTEDGGYYECRASNDVETVSHGARLRVRGPPFVRPMKNMSVLAGTTLTVSCPAAGHPISEIVWYKGGSKLPQSKRQSVYPNGTLTVQKVERSSDEGSYKCVVSNAKGDTASMEMFVTVLVAPVVAPISFPSTLKEGMRVIVTCSVIEGDSPVRIRWLKDKGPLAPNGANIKVESSNEFSSTLFIKNVNYKHRGEYTCVATNNAASANQTANMVVNVAPRWKMMPKDKSAVVGENVVVDCQAEGSPHPRIWWEKSSGSSGSRPSEYKIIISNSHIHTLENGSLMVREAEQNDTGSYLCQANNGVGSGISKVIELKVHVPANFKSAFSSKTLRKGATANLKCEVFGEKPLTIAWNKNGQPFTPTMDQRYDVKTTDMDASAVSEMKIHAADRRDSALFSCLGTNEYGQDETRIQLIVQEPPGAPFNVHSSNIVSRAFTVSWDQPYTGNSPISSYKVQYKEGGTKWGTDTQETTVQGSTTTLALRGLRPVGTYIVRIRAENSLGPGQFSQEIQVTTDEEAPESPPLSVQATPLSSSTIKVTWKAPKKDLQNGLLKGYYVGYRQHSSSDSYTYKTLEIHSDFREETVLSSLRRSTKYSVLVQAFNSKGSGPPSEEITVETFDSDPPPSPTLSVLTTSASSIQLQWDSHASEDSPALGYYLYIKEQFGTWEELQLSAHQSSHIFQDLYCGTSYQFYLVSYNKMGKGEPSEVLSAKTQGSAPVAPKRDALITVNATTLVIHLSSWNSGGCPIKSFAIRYRIHEESDWDVVSEQVLPDQKVVEVTNLASGKWYILNVVAHSEAGSTEQEFTFSTLTRNGAAIPPLNSLEGRKPAFYRSVSIMVPIMCIVAVFIAVIVVGCVVVSRRRRQMNDGNMQDQNPEDKNLEAMSLSILKHTGSTGGGILPECSPNKEQSLYFPSPYGMGRVLAKHSSSESESTHSLKRLSAPRREHIYEVPYPRWSEEEETYSHIMDNSVTSTSNIYQTPRKQGTMNQTHKKPLAPTPPDGRRLSREGRGNHRTGYKSSSLASDGHSADDSDSEGGDAFQRNWTTRNCMEHQEMSEAECDRDQHCRVKRLDALGIHITPGYSIT